MATEGDAVGEEGGEAPRKKRGLAKKIAGRKLSNGTALSLLVKRPLDLFYQKKNETARDRFKRDLKKGRAKKRYSGAA